MSTSETAATETTTPPASLSPLVIVRRRLDAAEGQLRAVPSHIRATLDRLLRGARERVRAGLNLPSQAEIEALIARVEELDRKLALLSTVSAPAPAAAESEAPQQKKQKKNGR